MVITNQVKILNFLKDDRNPYSCPPTPRHMGAFVSNLGYQ